MPVATSIPFDAPRARTGRDVLFDIKAGLDFVAHNLPRAHDLLVRINPYPKPWRPVVVDTHDGQRLSGWYGPGRADGPAVLMVPGTFQTKDDTPRKRRALDVWRRFGAHVLIIDLRGFGGSHQCLGSAGYHEARDLHAAADRLRAESGARRVHVWGESLGGAVSLLAGALPGAAHRFESVIAWSPFADLSRASAVASPDTKVGRSLLGRTYRWLLRRRTSKDVKDFEQYLALCATQLGIGVDELLRRGSPLHHVGSLEVPAFVFHARDDPVVPVWHAERLAELAGAHAPRLSVEIVPRGQHLDFDRAAPQWYQGVTRRLVTGPAAQTP